MQMAVTLQNHSEVFNFPVFSLCFSKIFKFPVFSLSGITFHNFPCFPGAVGTLKQVISTFKFGYSCLTLKQGPKVKSVHTRRLPAHDFPYVGLPSQTSRTNNKRVISTFKFGSPRLTLKEEPKVKSDHTRRLTAHDFLCVGLPS